MGKLNKREVTDNGKLREKLTKLFEVNGQQVPTSSGTGIKKVIQITSHAQHSRPQTEINKQINRNKKKQPAGAANGKSTSQNNQNLLNGINQPKRQEQRAGDSVKLIQPKQQIKPKIGAASTVTKKTGVKITPKRQDTAASGDALPQPPTKVKKQLTKSQQQRQNKAALNDFELTAHVRVSKTNRTEKISVVHKKQHGRTQQLPSLKKKITTKSEFCSKSKMQPQQPSAKKQKNWKSQKNASLNSPQKEPKMKVTKTSSMPMENGNGRAQQQKKKLSNNSGTSNANKAVAKRPAAKGTLKQPQEKRKAQHRHAPIMETLLVESSSDDSDSDANSITYLRKHLPGYNPDDVYVHNSDDDGKNFSIGDDSAETTDDDEAFSISDNSAEADDDSILSAVDDDDTSSLNDYYEYNSIDNSFDNDEYLDGLYRTDDDLDADDEDYKLPEHILEDLIIHQGTATIYEIPKEDRILLDNYNEHSHIVEYERTFAQSVQQPKAYAIAALRALNETHLQACPTAQNDMTTGSGDLAEMMDIDALDDCPILVPISASDFELSDYLAMDGFDEHYEAISDDDASIVTIDVNEKYISYGDDCSSDMDTDDDESSANVHTSSIRAEIVHAEQLPVGPAPCLNEFKMFSAAKAAASDFLYKQLQCEVHKIPVHKMEEAKLDLNAATNSPSTTATSVSSAYMNDETSEAETLVNASNTTVPSAADRNFFCNAINSNDVLLLLKDVCNIYGTLRLTRLCGNVEVYGHVPLLNKCVEVYSPRGCSLVVLRPDQQQQLPTTSPQLAAILKQFSGSFKQADLQLLQEKYTPGVDAVLLLQRNVRGKKLVSNFKKFMNENIFPNMNSMPSDRVHHTSEYLLQCMINCSDSSKAQNEWEKCLRIPPGLQALKLCANTKMLITGGKAVGKSTLLRYVVNRHVQQYPRILLIDLDIGQPELFVPQTISCTVLTEPLLGPGFFLLRQPDKAYFVGHVNVAQCATPYMRAVQLLLAYCHAQPSYANIPWLVNTMGYNKGFALELVACIADHLRPTDIVQMRSKKNINNFDIPLERASLRKVNRMIYSSQEFQLADEEANVAAMASCQLHTIDSAVLQESRYQRDWDMTAKDWRYALLLARFTGALHGSAEWLTDCMPLRANIDQLHFIDTTNSESTHDELLEAVECNLVYLCQFEGKATDDSPLECYGIGVIRGLDRRANQLYMVPAIVHAKLDFVNCLALGHMPLPNSLFINQGPKIRGRAPFVCNTSDANASKAVKQIYYRPTEFLTGAHREV